MEKLILKVILWGIAFNLCINSAMAQSITALKINKEVFKPNDELKITATPINNLNIPIYLQYLLTTKQGPSISNIIKISPNTSGVLEVYKTKINETDFRNGEYSMLIRLTDEIQNKIYDSKKLSFKVEGLSKEFNIELFSCSEEECSKKNKIFILNDNIYLNYNSDIDKLVISAVLTFPNKTTKQIILPTSIKSEQLGTYTLEVTAGKQGYKTITKKEQFAVIEKEAEIKSISKCNGNKICDGEEDSQNCPQDCSKKEKRSFFENIKRALLYIFQMISKVFEGLGRLLGRK